jgi:hypothetical protein
MFVIYRLPARDYLDRVVPDEPLPLLFLEPKFSASGIIANLEDAIWMANEAQRVFHSEDLYHFTLQILPLGPNNIPDFNHPAYEIKAENRYSKMN